VNETDLEALTREIEELSVDLEANSLQFIGVLKHMPRPLAHVSVK
jgi:hypothetical protein